MCDIFLILFEKKASMPLWIGTTPAVGQVTCVMHTLAEKLPQLFHLL
jgi:hypothetical protein